MTSTTSSISGMALLLIALLPTIIASSNINLDETPAVEIESSRLRKRKVKAVAKPIAEKRPQIDIATPPPTPSPVPPPPPTSIFLEVQPVKDIFVSSPTPNPTPNPPPPFPVLDEYQPIKDIGLFVPTTPQPTNPPTPHPTAPPPKVITLGDSYSSGTGIHRDGFDYDVEFGGNPTFSGISYDFTANSEHACWMETDTTPGPRYASLMGQESVFLGCGGAQLPHVNSQLDYLLAKYPVDRANNFQGSTFLFTIGGNDIRTNDGKTWPELLEHCIKLPFKGCHKKSENHITNFAAIQSSLTAFYTRLAIEASGAKIRVLGYPKMMQRDPGCGSVTGVSRNEADWIDVQCVNLNNSLIAAVNSVKASYASVDIEFVNVYNYLTVGACGDGPNNRHVNDKILHSYWPWKTSDSSFHPSQLGYNKYYDALLNSL